MVVDWTTLTSSTLGRTDGLFTGPIHPHDVQRALCDAHHVIHWIDGGHTALGNLVLCCDHHHNVLHQPGWTTTFDGHELHIDRPDGLRLTE